MAAKAPRLGRALQGTGLVLMPVAVVGGEVLTWGLGTILIVAFVGLILILTGRSLASDPAG
jgi:hypothetical protein